MNGNSKAPRNVIFNADCIDVMDSFDTGSVDFILTDPPYITRYKSRQGHTVINDDNSRWLQPAFNQMHRVLKDVGLCVSFRPEERRVGKEGVSQFKFRWRP